jgi:hypothetical protein
MKDPRFADIAGFSDNEMREGPLLAMFAGGNLVNPRESHGSFSSSSREPQIYAKQALAANSLSLRG